MPLQHFNVQKGVDKVKKALWMYMMLGVGLLVLAPSAKATSLSPPTSATSPDALPVGCFVPVIGATGCPTILVADATGTFTGSTSASGLYIAGTWNEVVLADSTNVWCPYCLDFEFQLINNSGNDAVNTISWSDFTGYDVDAGYNSLFAYIGFPNSTAPSSVVDPTTVDENSSGTVDFYFPNPGQIAPGSGSAILVIETNAMDYQPGTIGLINSSVASIDAFAPAPEPVTFSLLGLGLLGLLGLRKKAAA